MPVLSLCPRCRAVMPPSPERSPCRKCGEVVLPAQRKICVRCGTDVTNAKRVKDAAGEYYCQPCWDELGTAGRPRTCACSNCGRTFRCEVLLAGADGGYVCPVCLDKRNDPDNLLAAAADAAEGEPLAASTRASRAADAFDDARAAELRRLGIVWSIIFAAVVTFLLIVAVRLTAR